MGAHFNTVSAHGSLNEYFSYFLKRTHLRCFINFFSQRIIIFRKTASYIENIYLVSRIFFRSSSKCACRRLDWHCKCINVRSYRVRRQFAFVPRKSFLSRRRRNFNLGNIFPRPREKRRSFLFSASLINAAEKKRRSLSLSLSLQSLIINLSLGF